MWIFRHKILRMDKKVYICRMKNNLNLFKNDGH